MSSLKLYTCNRSRFELICITYTKKIQSRNTFKILSCGTMCHCYDNSRRKHLLVRRSSSIWINLFHILIMHIQRLWERFCKPNIIKVINFEKKLLLTSYPQVFCPYMLIILIFIYKTCT